MRGSNVTIDRRKGRHTSTVRERVAWMRGNAGLWDRSCDDHTVVLAMKRDGLISKKTYWKDVNVQALIRLIAAGDK